jgi:hypothetical protein
LCEPVSSRYFDPVTVRAAPRNVSVMDKSESPLLGDQDRDQGSGIRRIFLRRLGENAAVVLFQPVVAFEQSDR